MQTADNDVFLSFADEEPVKQTSAWKILVADDDEEVHLATRMVLNDFRFHDRGMEIFSAHSATEAGKVLEQQPDIALLLLDVVMETEDAGLKFVQYIRENLKNDQIRIILRTGQPGQAPERRVVLEYDINDYKEKTELTSQKLLTAVISALRAHELIQQVNGINQELEHKVRERTREVEAANSALRRSLAALEEGERAGRRVQFHLLPESNRVAGPYRFEHLLRPSEFMSGDFVDHFEVGARQTIFYMADVSGHGVSSAFVTVYLKRFISTRLQENLSVGSRQVLDPAALLGALNLELITEGLGKFIAILYGVIDHEANTLTFANAGSYPWPALLVGSRLEWIESRSTPAGLFDFSEYANTRIDLPNAFDMYLFSDGVLEVLDAETTAEKVALLEPYLSKRPDPASLCDALGVARSGLPDDLAILHIQRQSGHV